MAELCRAEDEKAWHVVSEILDNAKEADVDVLKPVIPRLVVHRHWLARVSAVELVGNFQLGEFLELVRGRLDDRNVHVKCYALMACYDLLGAKALPLIQNACQDRSVHVRVTALALCYVVTEDRSFLNSLERVVLRKNCDYLHRYAVLHIFDRYLDVSSHPELLEMFRAILRMAPRRQGISKDIAKKLETGFRV